MVVGWGGVEGFQDGGGFERRVGGWWSLVGSVRVDWVGRMEGLRWFDSWFRFRGHEVVDVYVLLR